MIDNRDPFGYPFVTYLWVFGLALIGGAVKYINQVGDKFSALALIRDLITAGFTGLLTFWLCQWINVSGPLSAVLIATSGLMGTRALKELENLYRLRIGMATSGGEGGGSNVSPTISPHITVINNPDSKKSSEISDKGE